MTEAKAKTLTVAAVGGAAVLSSLEHIAKGDRPPLTVFVGAGVAGVLLLGMAEVSPAVAGGFALLLLIGALLRNGTAAAAALDSSLGK